MGKERKDKEAAIEDFQKAMRKKLSKMTDEQKASLITHLEHWFEKSYEYTKRSRKKLDKQGVLLSFLHKAEHYLKRARPKRLDREYIEELGYGLGFLMGCVEYGCFGKEWQEEATYIEHEALDAIKELDKAEKTKHHEHSKKRVQRIVHKHAVTKEEAHMGKQVIKAFA